MIRLERERLARERDKRIDEISRRCQKAHLEFEETTKAEADKETRRLDKVIERTEYKNVGATVYPA